jgi:hypothetical protein
MIKNPNIQVDGKAEITNLYSRMPDTPSSWLSNGDIFTHEGNLTLKLAHTETFQSRDNPSFYATYLDFINYDNENQHRSEKNTRYQKLSIPGDVSAYAKENGISIPIGQILFSETNKKVLYSFTIVAIVGIYLSWNKIKNRITPPQHT